MLKTSGPCGQWLLWGRRVLPVIPGEHGAPQPPTPVLWSQPLLQLLNDSPTLPLGRPDEEKAEEIGEFLSDQARVKVKNNRPHMQF